MTAMSRKQAAQLGQALIAWSRGIPLERRCGWESSAKWYPFTPGEDDCISVAPGMEWRTVPMPKVEVFSREDG